MTSPTVLDVPASLKMGPVRRQLHERIWQKIGWRPYDLQRQVLTDSTRLQVFAAGRRAGKSQVGGHKLLPEAYRALSQMDALLERGLRREFWIVGPEYSDAEKEFRVFYDGMKRLGFEFDHPGTYNNPEAGQMRVSCFDEKFIVHAKSAKYPETLVGEGLSGVVFSEAAKLKPSVWTKFIRPTLADFLGWAYFGSTPEGKNWFHDLWDVGQDKTRPEWRSWRAPSWANPYVYPGGVDEELLKELAEAHKKGALSDHLRHVEMLQTAQGISPVGIHPEIWSMFQDMSLELFNQEIACLFTEYVGRVFKDYDEEVHVVDQAYIPGWETYACADYGFTNPFVWLIVQIDPHHERVHIVDEYYEVGRTTEEACDEIEARGLAPRTVRAFFPDPAEPDRTRTVASRLRIASRSPGSLERKDRIEWIRRGLKYHHDHLPVGHPERVPRLTINRKCYNTRREMDAYKYKETAEQASEKNRSAPEEPLKKDDHSPEALGRFYSGFFGRPHGGSRQSKINVRRRR